MLGYVNTNYGERSKSSVESEVSAYKRWYNVNGIMIDEMSNTGVRKLLLCPERLCEVPRDDLHVGQPRDRGAHQLHGHSRLFGHLREFRSPPDFWASEASRSCSAQLRLHLLRRSDSRHSIRDS